jgi:hypothetical protein
MVKSKYAQNIVTELKAPQFLSTPEYLAKYRKFAKRVLWMDDNVVPGAFNVNLSWYLHPKTEDVGGTHSHAEAEILGFIGSDPDNPHDLGGELAIWIEDKKYPITKSGLIFLPPNTKHAPIDITRVDRPLYHFNILNSGKYETLHDDKITSGSDYAKNIVTELYEPEQKRIIAKDYAKYATRILWMDEDVVPGAFHMNTSWFFKAGPTLESVPHSHDDPEVIAFFSSDPDKPHDLGAEVEFWIDGEKHLITKSAMIFMPPHVKHCPMILNRVDRPIFHFTVVTNGLYIKDEKH